ncbi:gamma-glutamylcyclotransferase family protein [Variovorax rhizosphaerae]|uniref:Gamma-glutamylcyclotransferase family protein n=1 Tax=Variovorax rhizosphaerae TaxID=1836200 RepID=A0ABU8WPC8_9BURK
MERFLLFVFGTLKEGFPNAATNEGRRIEGEFVTLERYPLYLVGDRHSPWMIDLPGQGHRVAGQLFEVDEAALARMDALERITEPDGYRRERIQVVGPQDAVPVEAHVYLRPQLPGCADIRSGPLEAYLPEHARMYRSRLA